MRSVAAAVVLIAAVHPAIAGGWKTVVTDLPSSVRSIALMGLGADVGETPGIAVTCTGIHEGFPAMLFATVAPSGRYGIAPGHAGEVHIGGLTVIGKISVNDSRATSIDAEGVDLDAILAAIAADSPTKIRLTAGEIMTEFEVGGAESRTAIDEFSTACDL